jgi:hypothetical protein
MKIGTSIRIKLFIKVMLVSRQRLFAPPFHVFDQTPKPTFNLFLAFRCLVNIPNFACDVPMAALVDIRFDASGSTRWIPVMFSIFLWGELCTSAG